MAKKLKVITPQTTDGKNLAYDADKKVIVKESIVELTAKRDFDGLNSKLPKQLQSELVEIEVDDAGNEVKEKKAEKADKKEK